MAISEVLKPLSGEITLKWGTVALDMLCKVEFDGTAVCKVFGKFVLSFILGCVGRLLYRIKQQSINRKDIKSWTDAVQSP